MAPAYVPQSCVKAVKGTRNTYRKVFWDIPTGPFPKFSWSNDFFVFFVTCPELKQTRAPKAFRTSHAISTQY